MYLSSKECLSFEKTLQSMSPLCEMRPQSNPPLQAKAESEWQLVQLLHVVFTSFKSTALGNQWQLKRERQITCGFSLWQLYTEG